MQQQLRYKGSISHSLMLKILCLRCCYAIKYMCKLNEKMHKEKKKYEEEEESFLSLSLSLILYFSFKVIFFFLFTLNEPLIQRLFVGLRAF